MNMNPYYTRVLIRDLFGNVVVVVHRDRKVALPGGKIENGEDPKTAAIREVLEETGIVIYDMRLIHQGLYEFTDGPHMGVFFEATNWSGAPMNKEPTKLAHVGWVTEAFLMATQHPRLTDTLRAANRG